MKVDEKLNGSDKEKDRKENTVIIIAHRFSMAQRADNVVVLSAGEVAEEGTPEELIAKGGWFAGFAHASEQSGNANSNEDDNEEGDDDESKEEVENMNF